MRSDPASSRLSGSRSLNKAANSQARSRLCMAWPFSSMWASLGCSPSWARCWPWGSRVPLASMAPSCSNRSLASSRGAAGGGSSQSRSSPMGSPQAASCRASGRGSISSSSGGSKLGRRCCSAGLQSRRQRPGPSRPARPARCSALARLAATVTSPSMPLWGSKRERRLRPLSITSRTPASVRELSAIEVASTTLPSGVWAGAMAWLWAARGRLPWRATQSIAAPQSVAPMARRHAWISRWPGRNTSTVSWSTRWSIQCCSRARSTSWSSRSPSRGRRWSTATG